MRFARLLAAAAALWVQPAYAVTVTHGLRFEGETYYDWRFTSYPGNLRLPIIGSFTFNIDDNRLEAFNFSIVDYPTPNFTSDINDMLARHPGCNVGCFVDALNGSAWSFDGRRNDNPNGLIRLSFTGNGFNEVISKDIYTGGPPRDFGARGTFFAVTPVPEPVTWALMLVGFGAIGWSMRRRYASPTAASAV